MQSVTYQISTVSESTYYVKELAHSWGVNGHSVRLFKSGDKLTYETSKRATGQVIARFSISYAGCIDSVIEIMKTRHPLLKQSGQVIFCPLYRTWCIPGKAVRLIKYNKELSWSVSSPPDFDVVRPFKGSTISSLICHEDTQSLIEILKMGRDDHIASCLDKDFIVTRVLEEEEFEKEHKERKKHRKNEPPYDSLVVKAVCGGYNIAGLALGKMFFQGIGITLIEGTAMSIIGPGMVGIILPIAVYETYRSIKNLPNKKHLVNDGISKQQEITSSSIEKPIFIEIEPISVHSLIEQNAKISKFTWSVTLITGPQGYLFNHASILIEGIASSNFSFGVKEGEYFMCQAHLVPPVKTRLITKEKFKSWFKDGFGRSVVWMRSSQKVSNMLMEIMKERHEQNEIIKLGNLIEWSYLGKDSLYDNGSHSCISWAIEKLILSDIHLPKSKTSKQITIPRMYTEPTRCYDGHPFYPQI